MTFFQNVSEGFHKKDDLTEIKQGIFVVDDQTGMKQGILAEGTLADAEELKKKINKLYQCGQMVEKMDFLIAQNFCFMECVIMRYHVSL